MYYVHKHTGDAPLYAYHSKEGQTAKFYRFITTAFLDQNLPEFSCL